MHSHALGPTHSPLPLQLATHVEAGAQSAQADEAERLATEAYSDYAIGVAAVAVEAGLSGLSNVYFEKVSGGRSGKWS